MTHRDRPCGPSGRREAAGGREVKNEDAETVVGQPIERITADG